MNKELKSEKNYEIMVFALTYGISFYYLKMFGKQNSWLIVTISTIIGFLFIKMIADIKNNFHDKSIYEINEIVLGKILGKIVNFIFAATFILIIAIVLWYLSIFLKTNFLYKTPILIINIVLILPLLYISNKNSSVIIKTSHIFSIIISILMIISIIFLFPQIELNNLKPFEEISNNNTFKALFCFTSVTYLPTYAISGLEKRNNQKLKYNYKVLFLIISIVLSTYLVLGNSIVEIVDFPEFFVLRKIGIFANGTRIDSLLIMGWILSIYVFNATCLLYVKNYIKAKQKNYHDYNIYIVIILMVFLSNNIFKNINIGKSFILDFLPYIIFFNIFIINFIIFCKIKVRSKISHKYQKYD